MCLYVYVPVNNAHDVQFTNQDHPFYNMDLDGLLSGGRAGVEGGRNRVRGMKGEGMDGEGRGSGDVGMRGEGRERGMRDEGVRDEGMRVEGWGERRAGGKERKEGVDGRIIGVRR